MMHPRLPLHREDSRLKPLLLLLTTLIIMTCEGMSDVYAAIIVLLSSLESINQSKHREVKNQNTKFKRKKMRLYNPKGTNMDFGMCFRGCCHVNIIIFKNYTFP